MQDGNAELNEQEEEELNELLDAGAADDDEPSPVDGPEFARADPYEEVRQSSNADEE